MNTPSQTNLTLTRRQMLRGLGAAGAVAAFPTIVPSSVFGKAAPSNRINVGMVGMGRQALHANLKPVSYTHLTLPTIYSV